MVSTGLVVGNCTVPRMAGGATESLRVVWQAIDEILDSLLFVMIGLSVVVVHPIPGIRFGIAGVVAILICLAARAASVALPIAGLRAAGILDASQWGLTALLTWGGLRGGLALALALSIPDSPSKAIIVNMTYAVTVFSILVQGGTIGRVFKPQQLKGLLTSSR